MTSRHPLQRRISCIRPTSAEFTIVPVAGHAFSEPGILKALVAATDRFALPADTAGRGMPARSVHPDCGSSGTAATRTADRTRLSSTVKTCPRCPPRPGPLTPGLAELPGEWAATAASLSALHGVPSDIFNSCVCAERSDDVQSRRPPLGARRRSAGAVGSYGREPGPPSDNNQRSNPPA